MMRTYEPLKFLGRLFWLPLRVEKGTPVATYTSTWEAEPPYRFGPTVVVRLPFRWGVGLGIWLDTNVESLTEEFIDRSAHEEEEAAFDAYVAVNGPVDRERWDDARKAVAGQGLDPDEEMLVMQELGIFGGDANA